MTNDKWWCGKGQRLVPHHSLVFFLFPGFKFSSGGSRTLAAFFRNPPRWERPHLNACSQFFARSVTAGDWAADFREPGFAVEYNSPLLLAGLPPRACFAIKKFTDILNALSSICAMATGVILGLPSDCVARSGVLGSSSICGLKLPQWTRPKLFRFRMFYQRN